MPFLAILLGGGLDLYCFSPPLSRGENSNSDRYRVEYMELGRSEIVEEEVPG